MYLQDKNKRGEHKITILKQKVIDHYIVDFYVPQYSLVIEIDGNVHDERQEYDRERTKILEWYGLQEIRFTNNEVQNDFETVCSKLETLFNKSCVHPL